MKKAVPHFHEFEFMEGQSSCPILSTKFQFSRWRNDAENSSVTSPKMFLNLDEKRRNKSNPQFINLIKPMVHNLQSSLAFQLSGIRFRATKEAVSS